MALVLGKRESTAWMEEPRCRRHRQLVVMPKAVKQAWLTALLSQGLGERAGAPLVSLSGSCTVRGENGRNIRTVPGWVFLNREKSIRLLWHETSLYGLAGLIWCFDLGTTGRWICGISQGKKPMEVLLQNSCGKLGQPAC